MTNGKKMKELYPRTPTGVRLDVDGTDGTMTFTTNKDWWNAEYKEPTIEHEQKIDKSAMMYEIYMQGVNMTGEYQGCWVRFKEIEKIVDKYVR